MFTCHLETTFTKFGMKSLKNLVRMAPEMVNKANEVSKVMDETIQNGIVLNEESIAKLHKKNKWFRMAMMGIGAGILVVLGAQWL